MLITTIGLSVRVVTFFVFLGLLPNRVVPIAARAALALASLFFFIPVLLGASLRDNFSFAVFVAGKDRIPAALSAIPYQLIVAEVAAGMLLAVLVSVGMYIAEAFAGYIATIMVARDEADQCGEDHAGVHTDRMLKAALLLLFLYMLFHQQGFSSVLAFFAESVLAMPTVDSAEVGGLAYSSALGRFAEVGVQALMLSAALAVPVFVVSITVDLLFLLQRRYFRPTFSENLVPAARATVLVLLLSVSVYLYAQEFLVTQRSASDPGLATKAIGQLLQGAEGT